MDEEDKRIEEEMEKFKEHLERKYEVTKEDIIERLDTLNHELSQVIDTVKLVEEKMLTKEVFGLEMRNLATKTDAVDKRIDDWRDSTKTYFTVLGVIIAIVGIVAPIVIVLLTGSLS